jgi:hypothetical protein
MMDVSNRSHKAMPAFTPVVRPTGNYPVTYGSHPRLNGSVRYGGYTDPPLTRSSASGPGTFAPRNRSTGAFTPHD